MLRVSGHRVLYLRAVALKMTNNCKNIPQFSWISDQKSFPFFLFQFVSFFLSSELLSYLSQRLHIAWTALRNKCTTKDLSEKKFIRNWMMYPNTKSIKQCLSPLLMSNQTRRKHIWNCRAVFFKTNAFPWLRVNKYLLTAYRIACIDL